MGWEWDVPLQKLFSEGAGVAGATGIHYFKNENKII